MSFLRFTPVANLSVQSLAFTFGPVKILKTFQSWKIDSFIFHSSNRSLDYSSMLIDWNFFNASFNSRTKRIPLPPPVCGASKKFSCFRIKIFDCIFLFFFDLLGRCSKWQDKKAKKLPKGHKKVHLLGIVQWCVLNVLR